MIFIDDEQIAPEVLAERIGISPEKYARILKKPIFMLDESKVLKKKTVNSPLAKKTTYGIITAFYVKINGVSKRIRYAENQIPRFEGGVTRYEYKPERINIEGQTTNMLKFPDKAFFMFINPGNPTSPYADPAKKKFAYMDSVEVTAKAAAEMDNIQKALSHATHMDEDELVIVAKGLRILTSDDYEIGDLRVRLQQFAINPATNKRYVQAIEDEMVRVEGRIANMIDKGVFKLQTRGSTRQWVWAQGGREGEFIGDALMNPNEDAKQRLFNFIKSNLGQYLPDLMNSTDTLQADRKAREILAEAKRNTPAPTIVPDHLAAVNAPPLGLNERLRTFEDFKNFVASKGYPKTMVLIKEFMTATQQGVVTDANENSFLMKLFEKKDD